MCVLFADARDMGTGLAGSPPTQKLAGHKLLGPLTA